MLAETLENERQAQVTAGLVAVELWQCSRAKAASLSAADKTPPSQPGGIHGPCNLEVAIKMIIINIFFNHRGY